MSMIPGEKLYHSKAINKEISQQEDLNPKQSSMQSLYDKGKENWQQNSIKNIEEDIEMPLMLKKRSTFSSASSKAKTSSINKIEIVKISKIHN